MTSRLRPGVGFAAELAAASLAGIIFGAAALAFAPTQQTAWTIIAVSAVLFIAGIVSIVRYPKIAAALLGAAAGPVIGIFVLILSVRGG